MTELLCAGQLRPLTAQTGRRGCDSNTDLGAEGISRMRSAMVTSAIAWLGGRPSPSAVGVGPGLTLPVQGLWSENGGFPGDTPASTSAAAPRGPSVQPVGPTDSGLASRPCCPSQRLKTSSLPSLPHQHHPCRVPRDPRWARSPVQSTGRGRVVAAGGQEELAVGGDLSGERNVLPRLCSLFPASVLSRPPGTLHLWGPHRPPSHLRTSKPLTSSVDSETCPHFSVMATLQLSSSAPNPVPGPAHGRLGRVHVTHDLWLFSCHTESEGRERKGPPYPRSPARCGPRGELCSRQARPRGLAAAQHPCRPKSRLGHAAAGFVPLRRRQTKARRT